MDPLKKLFRLRESLHNQEKKLGINDYSEVERAVLEFVINKKEATITSIMNHNYFSKYSLSTINRVVAKLQSVGAIRSEQSLDDKRKMFLSYCLNK